MAKGLHNKHISTQWGVAILGFFIIATALLIPVLSQNQSLQSHAMMASSEPYKCAAGSKGIKYCPPISCGAAGGVCGKVCGKGKKINNTFTCSGHLNCCVTK